MLKMEDSEVHLNTFEECFGELIARKSWSTESFRAINRTVLDTEII